MISHAECVRCAEEARAAVKQEFQTAVKGATSLIEKTAHRQIRGGILEQVVHAHSCFGSEVATRLRTAKLEIGSKTKNVATPADLAMYKLVLASAMAHGVHLLDDGDYESPRQPNVERAKVLLDGIVAWPSITFREMPKSFPVAWDAQRLIAQHLGEMGVSGENTVTLRKDNRVEFIVEDEVHSWLTLSWPLAMELKLPTVLFHERHGYGTRAELIAIASTHAKLLRDEVASMASRSNALRHTAEADEAFVATLKSGE